MKILAIETTAQTCSVALLSDDVLTAEYSLQHKKTHSQSLVPMLEEIRRMSELDLAELAAIALTGGPGSFTGVRIGAATAKGIAMALDKPLIPVPTVDALAMNYAGSSDVICPLMDARRSQVYSGLYTFEGNELTVLRPQAALPAAEILAAADETARALGKRVILLGDGIAPNEAVIRETLTVPYLMAPPHLSRQRAASVAVLAAQIYAREGENSLIPAAEFRPTYLRESQAERDRAAGIDTSQVTRRDA